MKVLRASSNGSCLFISLRLAYECLGILKRLDAGVVDERVRTSFVGYGPHIEMSAEALRVLICKWFAQDKLSMLVPYDQDAPLTRRQVVAAELLRAGVLPDAPAAEVADELIAQYVRDMSMPARWGSMPEIIAFAMMAKCEVRVWQRKEGVALASTPSEYSVVDHVRHKTADGAVVDLLFRGCHYDLLLRDDVYSRLVAAYPFLADRVVDLPA